MSTLPPAMLQPFSDAELAELEELTMQEGWIEKGLPVEGIDGVLCALSLAAARVGPAEFLPLVRGDADIEPPVRMTDLIVRRWIDINNSFWGDSEYAYSPILLEAGEGEAWTPELQKLFEDHYGTDWAVGFSLGVEFLSADYTAATEADEGMDELLLAIYSLGTGQDLRSDDPDNTPLRYDQRQVIIEALPEQLAQAAEYFNEHPSKWRKQPLRVEKIGRNDPCPCGSGKKYKQCCLQSGT